MESTWERAGSAARVRGVHPQVTPVVPTDSELDRIVYDAAGLVPAIVQDYADGTVLMMAWMTAETLAETLDTGRMCFWSRSRQEVWRKGDTSGNRQFVRSAHYDCDGDTLLFRVEQEGSGACHTGERSCFHRAFAGDDADRASDGGMSAT